jgi:hypothetical protein
MSRRIAPWLIAALVACGGTLGPDPTEEAACVDVAVPEYPWIRLLQPCQADLLPQPHRDGYLRDAGGELVAFLPYEPGYEAILAGLERSVPKVRRALTRIAVVALPDCGRQDGWRVGADTYGNSLLLNACDLSDPARHRLLTQNVVHETAHAYEQLVDAVANRRSAGGPQHLRPSAWPAEVIDEARADIARLELQAGLTPSFEALQVRVGPYPDARRYPADDLVAPIRDGFANAYGVSSPCEDLATFVAAIQDPAGIEDALCATLSGAPSPLPRELTLAYTKADWLRSVGMVDEARFAACLRRP